MLAVNRTPMAQEQGKDASTLAAASRISNIRIRQPFMAARRAKANHRKSDI